MKHILFLLLILFSFPGNSFPQISAPSLASYDELRRQVREAFARGEERTADAVERERVQTYWEVGKLIDEHILLHQVRADYGEQVIDRLSTDLAIDRSELYRMVQFARIYPIVVPGRQLSWSHYKALLTITNAKEREEITRKAEEQNWNRNVLREEIEKLKAKNPESVSDDSEKELLIPIKGKLDTYRIVKAETGKWKGKPVIDLGFSNYYRPEKLAFKEGNIIRFSKGKFELAKSSSQSDLFTYRASILEITDGDTLWLLVDLGFGFSTKQHVRLRGIDAPEIATRDGQAAKKFVEDELKNISQLIITSTKSDKYDRYLADIYYLPARVSQPQFLNNRLLQERLAERV